MIGGVTILQKNDETQAFRRTRPQSIGGIEASSSFSKSLLSLGMGIPIILGLMIFASTPPLATHLERHSTFTDEERSIVISSSPGL